MSVGMTGHRALYLAVGLLLFCTAASTYWFYDHLRKNADTSFELTKSFLNIERSIGYAGFIHHFKNHVLRPNSPLYKKRARASFQLLTEEIATLQSIISRAGVQVDVTVLKATLYQYGDSIDEISKAHLRGVPVY